MLRQTCAFAADVRSGYDEFAFHRIYHRVNHFCIVDLSAFYFDVLKDRLYISAAKSPARRSAQTAIWKIGEALVRHARADHQFHLRRNLGHLPPTAGREESVHLASFPSANEIAAEATAKSDEDWNSLRSVVMMS